MADIGLRLFSRHRTFLTSIDLDIVDEVRQGIPIRAQQRSDLYEVLKK